MNNKKICLALLLGVFLISLISLTSATAYLGEVKRGSCIQLHQVCDSCTYVNFTSMQFPNKTVIMYKEAMTKDDIDYYHNFCSTNDLGTHYATTKGDKDGSVAVEVLTFEVTESGQSITEGKTLGGLGILLSVLAVGLLFMFIGSKLTANDRTFPVGFFFAILSVFIIIYSLHLGWIFSVNILQDEVLTQGLSRIFVLVIWSCAGMALIFFSLMLIAFIKELGKMNKRKNFGDNFNPITDTYE